MKTFVTSDTHFGHENIIRYCNRPFGSTSQMNEAMIERWNARVGVEDSIYFLGDFAMGRGVDEVFVRTIINQLNGFKIMILGNHDQPSKWGSGLASIVCDNDIRNVNIVSDQICTVKIDGKQFVMCHYPLADWDNKHHGTIHLHGHVHTQFRTKAVHDMKQMGRYDIGVDMYGGPVEITGDLRYLNDPKGWA